MALTGRDLVRWQNLHERRSRSGVSHPAVLVAALGAAFAGWVAWRAQVSPAAGSNAWLAGAWVGSRGEGAATTFEERWSPPLGGSMLAVSRTVSRGKMVGFEFLRVVERDGGLVYIAQPGGKTPTEFVLSELGPTRAVFENPRHDYPKRIVYELSADGGLSATIGFTKGGTPRRFEFTRESK